MRQGAQMLFMSHVQREGGFDAHRHMGQSSRPSQGVKVTASFPLRRVIFVWVGAAILFGVAWWWRSSHVSALDPLLSSLARRVIRASREPMHLARGAHARVYATDTQWASAVLEEAEFSIVDITRRLRVAVPRRTVRILLVSGADAWDPLVREKGFRPDSLAVNLRDEIFLKDDPDQTVRPDRLAHELVHFVLRQTYGADVPLWLDEGTAGRLGLLVSRDYRAEHGRRVTGSWPGLPKERVEPLALLTSRRALPDDPDSAHAFYRASEELVAMIEDRIGNAQMPAYVAEVATGADWRVALDSRLNGSALSSVDMEEAVRRQVASPRKF